MHAEESFVVPTDEVIIDASIDDVVIDDDQPQDASKPKPDRVPKNDLFKQPPRPPTLDPEWNSHQVDTLSFRWSSWPLFDFFKFAMNRLKINKLTKAHLVGFVYNLLKGTCQSSIELEYNMEECYKALSNQLDWNNHEGDRCPFDLSKPQPLKGRPGHLTVASEYFFNNDLEYLTSSDPKRMRRAGRQLYKFKEGDSMNLHLNDIEDMLLLVVQHKLFHLDGEVIVDLAVALRMFTRSLIIKKRVEDVQLDMLRRKWSAIDKKMVGIKVDLIDKLMLERRIIRNLERLVGARELEMDYRLMQRTGGILEKNTSSQNLRDLPSDNPLDKIEVLRSPDGSSSYYLYDTCMTDEFNISWLRGGHPVINVGDISVEASQLLNHSATWCLSAIAKKRPAFYGRILPVLLGLDPSTAAVKAGHVSGVHHALQNAFLSWLRCTHPGAVPVTIFFIKWLH
ncbi:retrovirus-related pol polyprotein from transposon TNT 1-94 [Tanacetum coccineum]